MRCPQCENDGLSSFVTEDGAITVTLVYAPKTWNERGDLVSIDPNTTKQRMRCSNGHCWTWVSGPANVRIRVAERD